MKAKKLVIAVILALIVCLVLIPTCAFADGDGDTPPAATPDHTETVNPNAGTTEEGTYTTLQNAVTAAEELEGTTEITVEEQPEGEEPLALAENVTINTENTIVIDLGGNTLNSKGDYTPAVTVNSGTVTLDNGTINGRIYVRNDAQVTLGKNLVLNGELRVNDNYNSSATTAEQSVVNVNCAINDTNTTNMAAICVWGDSSSGATINIGEGARVVSTHTSRAIFLYGGNKNVLNINGECYIEGSFGVEVDAGSLNVNNLNAKIVGTRSNAVAIAYVNGSVIGKSNISGGIFKGGIAQYSAGGTMTDENSKNFITGGRFYDDRPAKGLIATNAAQAWAKIGSDDIYAVGKDSIEALAKSANSGETVHVTAIYGENNEYVNGRYWVRSVEGVAADVIIQNDTGDTTKTEIAINKLVIDPGKNYVVPGATPDPDPDPDPKPTPAPVVAPEQTASEPLSAKYFVVDGKNQQWTAGDLEFKLDSKDVVKVIIDGVEVEFTVAEDGTVTIASAVIEALESGTHEIEFVYADGSCKTAFTVE